MLSKLKLGLRGWVSVPSVHLIHKKPIPPPPIIFSERGLIIKPQMDSLQPPAQVSFKLAPPAPELQPLPVPNTRYLSLEKPTPNPIVKATRKYMKTSVKKIVPLMKLVSGKHVIDAMTAMSSSIKKPAYWIKKVIEKAIRNGVKTKAFDRERLYVKYAVTGKNKHIPGIRYHAKGRSGRVTRPRTQITIVLEEKTPQQIYKEIMHGKFSPGMSNLLRNHMLTNDLDYQAVRNYQHMLTAKGRQQQKLMLKRKVAETRVQNKKQGLVIADEHLKEQILEEGAEAFAQNYWNSKRLQVEREIAERQEIYLKNEGT